MKLILLGAPGAGKGTQAARIEKKFGLPQISTGDLFRYNIKNQTELGKKVKGIMDRGELVPDSVVNELVLDRIARDDCKDGYILDGYPRTIPQAEAFDAALAEKGEAVDLAIDIEVPDDFIIERMAGRRTCPACGATFHVSHRPPKTEGICDLCGAALTIRDDDKPETVKKRLSVYHENTQPLIDYYKAQGKVREIDGTRSMDEVEKEVFALLS